MVMLLALLAATAVRPAIGEPQRFSVEAFAGRALVEVRDLESGAAEAAARAALDTMRELEALTDPRGVGAGGIGALNRAAGGEPVAVSARLMPLLVRALDFCTWSNGAHGPMGGALYELWGLRSPSAGLPTPEKLGSARESAGCDRLRLDMAQGTAQLGRDSVADLWGFAAGFAVDEAVNALRASGVSNGWVSAGGVERGFGPGPSGNGWPVSLPMTRGATYPGESFLLVDQAVGLADAAAHRLHAGGERPAAFIDQRRGRPVDGVLLTAAVSTLGVDAQALAVAAFVLGNREAQFRLGSLKPRPAVYWAMGGGGAEPVVTSFGWSTLRRK
jgi:thiamine biosynthesis lipoprotein